MTFTISTQRYPTHTGERPLSWAIYLRRRWRGKLFLGYSWSRAGAERAIQELKNSGNEETDTRLPQSGLLKTTEVEGL